jgi:hypothetical protein
MDTTSQAPRRQRRAPARAGTGELRGGRRAGVGGARRSGAGTGTAGTVTGRAGTGAAGTVTGRAGTGTAGTGAAGTGAAGTGAAGTVTGRDGRLRGGVRAGQPDLATASGRAGFAGEDRTSVGKRRPPENAAANGRRPNDRRHLRVVGQPAANANFGQPAARFAASPTARSQPGQRRTVGTASASAAGTTSAGTAAAGSGGAGAAIAGTRARRTPAPARSAAGAALPRIPFVLLVLGLLGGGLVCLLVVNTTLGATSFRISQLQRDNANLSLQKETLLGQVADEQSPEGIERRAYQLGMRAQAGGNILDLRTHRFDRLPGYAGLQAQYTDAGPSAGRTSAAARRTARRDAAARQRRIATRPKRQAVNLGTATRAWSRR